MHHLMPVIGNATIFDLSLPGTHDTLTYDLSTQTSDGGDDGHDILSKILHDIPWAVPGSFIRRFGVTQGLDVVDQLENGMRFLDLRIMYTSDDWYGLHFLQTNQKM